MRKAERGFGSGRIVWIALMGSLVISLAGCDGDSGSDSAGLGTTAATQSASGTTTTSTSTSTSTTGSTTSGSADKGSTTSDATTTGGGSSTTAGSTTAAGGGTTNSGGASPSSNAGSTTTSGSTTNTSGATTTSGSTSIAGSTVSLAWVPPTQNNNGTPLTNLEGYNIHYGVTSQNYSQTVKVANAGLSRYVLDSLPKGTYYFAIAAYNSAGIESTLSDEVTATVN